MRRAWLFALPVIAPAVFALLSGAIYAINMYHATDFMTKINPITAPMQALDTAPAFVPGEWNCTDVKVLNEAWKYGREAKSASADTISYYNVMRANDENAGYLWAVYGSYSNASLSFEKALSRSIDVFNSLLHTIYRDASELDKMGADRQEYSGTARQDWSEFREIDRKIGEWREDRNYAQKVSAYSDIGSKTVKIFQAHADIVHSGTQEYAPDTRQLVAMYNSILGYYSDSLLKSVCGFHSRALASMADMRDEYGRLAKTADEMRGGLSKKAGQLEQDIGLVTMQAANAITSSSPSSLRAIPSAASAPPSIHARVLSSIDSAAQLALDARTVYSRKQEDYVYNAIERLRTALTVLREQESSISVLDSQLGFLHSTGRGEYEKLLEERRGSMRSFEYGKALEYGASAESASRNKAIYYYSRAILLLRSLSDNSSLSPDFDYVESAMDSLEQAGMELSYERQRFAQLQALGNSTAVYAEVESLLERLRRRAEPLMLEAERLRQEASAALLTAEHWLEDPVLSRHLDAQKIREMRLDYEAALSEDPLSGIYRRLSVFGRIRDSLSLKISPLAGEFLERNAVAGYYPMEVPVCNERLQLKALVEVQNPSLVEFRDVSLATSLIFPATGIKIDYIAPGQAKTFEFSGSAIAASCGTGALRSLGATEDYADWSLEKKIALHVPLELLRIQEKLPGEITAVNSEAGEASFSKEVIEIRNPSNGTLFINYRAGSTLNVSRSLFSSASNDTVSYSLELSVRNDGAALENIRLRHYARAASNASSDARFSQYADFMEFELPFLGFGETKRIRASYTVRNVSFQAGQVIGEIGDALQSLNSSALYARYSHIVDAYNTGNYEAALRLGEQLLQDIGKEQQRLASDTAYASLEREFSFLEEGLVKALAELRSMGKDTREYEEEYARARLLKSEAEAYRASDPGLALKKMKEALDVLRGIPASDALFSLRSGSDEEYGKALMELGSGVALACSLADCGSLQESYNAAREKWKKGERTDLKELRALLEGKSSAIMASFSLPWANEYALLKDFQKAVDEAVGFNHTFALAYRESDYGEIKKEMDRLRDFSRENSSLEKMADGYTISFLKSYPSLRASVLGRLNSSLSELKALARTRLTAARDAYREAYNKEELMPFLKSALDSYESGYYNRAIIFSQKVRHGASPETIQSFPWEYAVALLAIAGVAAFALRRPQKPKKRFILRPYGEF